MNRIRKDYIGHASFRFFTPDGTVILADPFFGKGFVRQEFVQKYVSPPLFVSREVFQKYVSPPLIKPEQLDRASVIFISHSHGDHFDPKSVEIINKNTGAPVYAPDEVIDELMQKTKIENRFLNRISDGMILEIKDTKVRFLAGYDDSFDEHHRPNKFSMLFECYGENLFYSGDCHQYPPALEGTAIDSVVMWPNPVTKELKAFFAAVECREFVLMHGEKFDPGGFICNKDYFKEAKRIKELAPHLDVIIPVKITE